MGERKEKEPSLIKPRTEAHRQPTVPQAWVSGLQSAHTLPPRGSTHWPRRRSCAAGCDFSPGVCADRLTVCHRPPEAWLCLSSAGERERDGGAFVTVSVGRGCQSPGYVPRAPQSLTNTPHPDNFARMRRGTVLRAADFDASSSPPDGSTQALCLRYLLFGHRDCKQLGISVSPPPAVRVSSI
ncbi:hypothetical protein AAFF_G00008730 [Aldrovandia affinis]|uniref:Uncharacterized protein n=1 Tax=Aldrovandia affinis TaxID=143900 RepID=A0AAD7T6D1_9TELE|nr:hypothetical protein AAFF_G00008730 [Aldrovandia affinis]